MGEKFLGKNYMSGSCLGQILLEEIIQGVVRVVVGGFVVVVRNCGGRGNSSVIL